MCQNQNRIFIRASILIVISVIAGIIAGILFPDIFVSPLRFALIELISASIALGIASASLLNKNTRGQQSSSLAFLFRLLLFAITGCIFVSVIIIISSIASSAAFSVIFGIAFGFYTLLILSAVVFTDKLIKNYYQQ